MNAAEIDAGEFREGQRRDWNTASRGWREWNELIDETTQLVSDRMVEMAGIKAGDRVLDVAAGYGEPTLTAARVVGPEGSVVASDISSGMLAYGRERAAAAGLENIEFVESDAISLDLPGARVSTPRCRAGGSSSSPTERGRRPGSGASSSPGRGWRSPPGGRPSGCRCSRSR